MPCLDIAKWQDRFRKTVCILFQTWITQGMTNQDISSEADPEANTFNNFELVQNFVHLKVVPRKTGL